MVESVIHIKPVSRERDRDRHTQWEECQGHAVRSAHVMGDVARDYLWQIQPINNISYVPGTTLGAKYTPEIKIETTTSTDLAF